MIVEELVTLLGAELSPDAKANLESFKKGVGDVAKQVKAASVVVTGFAVAAGVFFKSVVDDAAALNTLSEQTGISTDKLQEWEYAANAVGVSASAVAGDLAKMERQSVYTRRSLENYADSFKGLSVKQANARGAALGLSPDTVRLLREGRDGLAKLRQEAHDLGAIIPGEDIKRAAELKRSLNELFYIFRSVTSIVMLSAVPAVQKIVDATKGWIKENRELISLHVHRFSEGVVTAFSRVWGILQKIWERLKPLKDNFKGFFEIFEDSEFYIHLLTGALGVLLIMFAPLIAKAIALAAIFTALSLIVEDFFTYLEGGDSVIGRLVDYFNKEFPALSELIKNTLGTAFEFVKVAIGGTIDAAKILFGWLGQILKVAGTVLNFVAGLVNTGSKWINDKGDAQAQAYKNEASQTARDAAQLYQNGGAGIPSATAGAAQKQAVPVSKNSQVSNNQTINVTQNINTSDPQAAANMSAQSIRNAQTNAPGLGPPVTN